jgi:hypothetical protein
MNEQMSNLPPPIPTEANVSPKRKWRWWQILPLIILGIIFVVKILANYHPISFDVRLYNDGITATNTGNGPITVNDVLINDRRECYAKLSKPRSLNVGEQIVAFSFCNIVRVQIDTNSGSEIYTFSGRP